MRRRASARRRRWRCRPSSVGPRRPSRRRIRRRAPLGSPPGERVRPGSSRVASMAESLEERFRRLLTMVPYIVKHPGVSVRDIRSRFGITRSQLVADLNLLFVCGLPGYGPGDLIEAFVDGNRVWIRLADYFSRPLRLTAAEGLLLYAGARALASAGAGDEALERAVG